MPIYEFYCRECHMIFNFLSRRIDTSTEPPCPKCTNPHLKRQLSTFTTLGKAQEPGSDLDMPQFDEHRMERALQGLAREADTINEDDPRQMANLMRKLTDSTGLQLGSAMEEALSRLEAGEDPEAIEQDMGELIEQENPFVPGELKANRKLRSAPLHDETLYEL